MRPGGELSGGLGVNQTVCLMDGCVYEKGSLDNRRGKQKMTGRFMKNEYSFRLKRQSVFY